MICQIGKVRTHTHTHTHTRTWQHVVVRGKSEFLKPASFSRTSFFTAAAAAATTDMKEMIRIEYVKGMQEVIAP